MRRWQRIRVFVLQGLNAAFGGVLIWLGVSSGIWVVAVVGGVLILFALVLLVFTLRVGVTEPKPRDPSDGR
jgi:hypothetical protein